MRKLRQRKMINLLVAAALLWWIGSVCSFPVQAVPEQTAVTIKAIVGINGEYKWDQITTVRVTMTNQGKDTAEGQIELSLPSSPISSTGTLYTSPVSLAKGETKTVFFRVPGHFNDTPTLLPSVRWTQQGKILAEQKLTPVGRSVEAVWTGILADEDTAAALLQAKQKEKPDIPVQLIRLSVGDLSQTVLQDSGLNVMLVEQEMFNHLSNTQKQAVQTWTQQGGLLLIVDPARLSFVWPEVEKKASVLPRPMTQNADEISRIAARSFASSLPDLPLLTLLFAGYVIIVGPVVFFIMRKRGTREWNWAIIPLVSVGMLALIYGYGTWIHGTDTRIQNVNLVQINPDGSTQLKSGSAIFAPKAGEYQIRLPQGTDVLPIEERTMDKKDVPVVTIHPKGNTEATFPHIEKWSLRTMYTQQPLPNTGAFESRLIQQNGKLVGTVRNRTSYTLHDVRIVAGENIQAVPSLPPGASAQVTLPLPPSGSEPRHYDDKEFARQMLPPALSQDGETAFRLPQVQLMRMAYDSINSGTLGIPVVLLGWTEQHPLRNEVMKHSHTVSNLTLVSTTLARVEATGGTGGSK